MTNKPHILFVDDEELILSGLKRGMRRHRSEWDMSFASSGADAYDIIAARPTDIIITDMQMPQMDGAELLEIVRKKSPDTARVVLSGYAKDEVILKVIGPAHQYLAKPCDFRQIEDTITRILRLRHCIENEAIRTAITGKTSLPSLPTIYQNLLKELTNEYATNKSIAAILEQDIALKAQVLKVCNSAFFGLPQKVTNLETAVSLLGLNTLRSMTLLNGVFSSLDAKTQQCKSLQRLTANCLDLAIIAAQIAKISNFDSPIVDLVTSAGSLSHIGSLLIAATWPAEFQKAAALCERNPGISIDHFEKQVIGIDHGLMGSYLLGLWGFPLPLCEAVAYHHTPHLIENRNHPILACLHIAQYAAKAKAHNELTLDNLNDKLDLTFLDHQNISLTQDMLDQLSEN